MKILDTIKGRRSIRDFKDQDIPEEAINALIEAIRWAPSAGNLQSRKFYFVFNNEIKQRLASATGNPGAVSRMKKLVKIALRSHHVIKAPLVIAACLDRRIAASYGDRGVSLYGIQDVAASIMNMMLTAHELGIGSVWLGAFDESEVAEILDLPDTLRPVAIIPVGYPACIPAAPGRRPSEDAVVVMR